MGQNIVQRQQNLPYLFPMLEAKRKICLDLTAAKKETLQTERNRPHWTAPWQSPLQFTEFEQRLEQLIQWFIAT